MRKFILERHRYSPEQNRIIFDNGATMRVPQCTSIKEVKEKYFSKAFTGIVFRIYSEYSEPEYKRLNKLITAGRIESRLKALQLSKRFKQAGGPLYNGDILPPNKIRIVFKFN